MNIRTSQPALLREALHSDSVSTDLVTTDRQHLVEQELEPTTETQSALGSGVCRGLFGMLSAELRNMIWSHVLAEEKHTVGAFKCNLLGSSSVLMRLTRVLRAETTNMFWHKIILHMKHDLSDIQRNQSEDAWNAVPVDRQNDIVGVVFTFHNIDNTKLIGLCNFAIPFAVIPQMSGSLEVTRQSDWPHLARGIFSNRWHVFMPPAQSDCRAVPPDSVISDMRDVCKACPRPIQSTRGRLMLRQVVMRDVFRTVRAHIPTTRIPPTEHEFLFSLHSQWGLGESYCGSWDIPWDAAMNELIDKQRQQ